MRLVLAASTGIAGSLTTAAVAAGNVIAQAAQSTSGSEGFPIGQALTAGGSVTVAGVLFWIVLGFRSGQIIAREPAKVAEDLAKIVTEQAALVAAGQTREDKLSQMNDDYRRLLLGRQGGST